MTQIAEQVTEIIRWIFSSYSRVPRERRQGFDRDVRHPEWTRRLLDAMGRPDERVYNVTVTGSKGKGSHAILTAAMLQQMGVRVGLFTSPHLIDFLERIRLQGMPIPEEDFVRVGELVREAASALPVPADQYIGPVGLVAVMAARWYEEQGVEAAVYELGRGARHDDVNQVVHRGAIVAPIFGEHLDRLGPTWEDVVIAKMGILTEHTAWAALSGQPPLSRKVMAPFLTAFRAKGGEVLEVGNDVEWSWEDLDAEGHVKVRGPGFTAEIRVDERLVPYADNLAASAAAAHRVLRDLGRPSREIAVDLRGLALIGRLQRVRREPDVVIDGAIHALSAAYVRRFAETWRAAREGRGRVHLVLSLPDDKDADGVMRELAPLADRILFTETTNSALHFTRDLVALAATLGYAASHEANPHDAIRAALAEASRDDLVLLVGTQSFVGDALRHFDVPTGPIWTRAGEDGAPC
ncbi:glutamate ligase domain-containing protein [Alicyclobacillus acidocaldarius]|uniref:tetrahydrofolate synthase n=1 Tax=Alicyclobacillus acidocaldarius subsp. acidocaldarius (strain ATCC 27009 / DSM 446 / BCRC 14685 / JCM 5260 / KCTC 1825 / NBRC 15652 / NCIMB 11725 / NRRL B-14509 / 104-IA) TaxID=521098 RepID=C8WR63_ALIAD|nr:bifunctional folylpolyglutamate synthase/dihydrofolate synthase [Alicyclobacillus acidocaldarius]ACV59232.1 FolC bifunctional protein [Alicyclobacillus acidocaldarius subsp. acidocaldarius DSM 446]